MAHYHRRPILGSHVTMHPGQQDFEDTDYDDEQPTVTLRELMLASSDSDYMVSDLSPPTHVPTTTSPTSLDAYEHHHVDSMDIQYERPEISLEDFRQIGSGPTVNADPASVLDGAEHLQIWPSTSTAMNLNPVAVWRDGLEQMRINAICRLWGFSDNGTPFTYADTLRHLEWWVQQRIMSMVRPSREQPRTTARTPGHASIQHSRPGGCYRCIECNDGRQFSRRSTIQRHLIAEHTRHEFYICLYCNVLTYRRDKVNDHYRSHFEDGELMRGEINSLRRLTNRPIPRQCTWCYENVVSWDGLVNCMIEHCRLPEQSDDISGNSGNNGNRGNRGQRPGDGNNHASGPAGGGSSGMPQQGSFNGLPGIDRSIESNLWNSGSSRRSSQSTTSTESKPKVSEHESPSPAESVIDDGEPQSKSLSYSLRSDILGRAVKTKDRESKGSRQDMPPRECRKCGHIVGSCLNCPQDGTATFGCHNCNPDGQSQLRPSCLVGEYEHYKGNMRSLLPNGVPKEPCIHPAVKNIYRYTGSVNKGLLRSIPPYEEATQETTGSRKVFSDRLPLPRILISPRTFEPGAMIALQRRLEPPFPIRPAIILSSMQYLRRGGASMHGTTKSTSTTITISGPKSNLISVHHKRLSALRTRLRVVAMLLVLQATTASMHMSQTEPEDDILECSPDWDSISRSNFAPVMGRIVHYMFIQLLQSLSCQMLNAWKQVCQVNMTPRMVDYTQSRLQL